MNRIYGPELAARAFEKSGKLEMVAGEIATRRHECDFCGREVLEGDKISPWKPRAKFMDHDKLHALTGWSCIYCISLFQTQTARSGPGTGYVTAEGHFPIGKDEDRVRFLLDPPEGPFAVAVVEAQVQHVWQYVETGYDPNRIPIRMGTFNVIIDRPYVLELADLIERWETSGDKPRWVFIPSGIQNLRKGAEPRFTPTFTKDDGPETALIKDKMNGLNLGNYWALAAIGRRARKTR